MSNYGEHHYFSELQEPLSYRLSADVNVDDLYKFIIENVPYKKVLRLRFLLNASTKENGELTMKELNAMSKFCGWDKEVKGE